MHAPSHLAQLASLLRDAESICVLTGAGISKESGVPTFRGDEGLWNKYRAEDLATPEAFGRDPMLVWNWYAWRRELISRVEPNAAHFALAATERHHGGGGHEKFTVLTQNVDGLHERAGSRNVVRLHGSIWSLRCTSCGKEREDRSVPLKPFPPQCSCSDDAARRRLVR